MSEESLSDAPRPAISTKWTDAELRDAIQGMIAGAPRDRAEQVSTSERRWLWFSALRDSLREHLQSQLALRQRMGRVRREILER
jgi:hypothetical protein